jgi:hypothetical protein
MESNQNPEPIISIYDSLWEKREKILKSPVKIIDTLPGYVNHFYIWTFLKKEWDLYTGADKIVIFNRIFSINIKNSVEMVERGDFVIFRLVLALPDEL